MSRIILSQGHACRLPPSADGTWKENLLLRKRVSVDSVVDALYQRDNIKDRQTGHFLYYVCIW